MKHAQTPQQPLALAICKKLSPTDSYYSWSLLSGDALLLEQVKTIYQEFFHLKDAKVPQLALIAEDERIGVLLIDEHGGAQEDNHEALCFLAMYVEFERQDAPSVFRTAATLLCAYDNGGYPEDVQRFRDYFRDVQGEWKLDSLPELPPFELPDCDEEIESEHTFLSTEIALPSIRHNRRKCACYLRELSEADNFRSSLIFVSAGRVTREVLQQFADTHSLGQLVVLTLSATVQEELDLRSAAERYIPETIRERIMQGIKKFFPKD